MSVEIIPAILPPNFEEITEKVASVKGLVKTVQVDICDGRFVPNTTWPYGDRQSFVKLIKEEEGLPAWKELDYEFDLMINAPEKAIEDFMACGASRLILHAESKGDLAKAVDIMQGKVEIGVALNVDTPIEVVEDKRFGLHEGKLNFVQLMGIDRIGFQHQAFDDKVIGRIKLARLKYPSLPISVDGGVSLDNAKELIAAGADRLVVGSALFNSENIAETIREFQLM